MGGDDENRRLVAAVAEALEALYRFHADGDEGDQVMHWAAVVGTTKIDDDGELSSGTTLLNSDVAHYTVRGLLHEGLANLDAELYGDEDD